jgi:hypothetical protein
VGIVALLVGNAAPWLRLLQLSPTLSPALPAADVPEWALLAAHVPPDGVIATDAQASTLVSARGVAYTYDQSLQDKAPGRGLRAVEYLLVQKRHAEWVARAEAEEGATLLGETQAYRLYRFPRTPAQLVPGRVPGARPAGGAGDVAPGGAAGDANLRGRHRLGAP